MYTTEFEINETPPSARTLLTKGYIQDEINSFSGTSLYLFSSTVSNLIMLTNLKNF